MTELLFVILMIALFVVLLAVVFDSVITTKEYRIKTGKLAKPLRIAFLPDLLSDDSPSRLIRVVRKTAALHPDIVIVCGKCAQNTKNGRETLKKLSELATVYLCESPFMSGACSSIEKGEYKILGDYSIVLAHEDDADMLAAFSKLDNFKIALLSKPSMFGEGLCASRNDIDLFFAWHSCGTLLRFPFYGALYTKEDGFLPKYYSGIYNENDSAMVVTGGVGTSPLRFRLNNFRQIVLVVAEN